MDTMYLAHHGVKGMKWGVRRYQNVDGTLTNEGRKHSKNESKNDKKANNNKKKRKVILGVSIAAVSAASLALGAAYINKKLNLKVDDRLTKKYKERGQKFFELMDDYNRYNDGFNKLSQKHKQHNPFGSQWKKDERTAAKYLGLADAARSQGFKDYVKANTKNFSRAERKDTKKEIVSEFINRRIRRR